MKRLRITPSANGDLRHIHFTIAKDRPTVAAAQIAAIGQRFKVLTQFPDVGEPVDGLLPGMRRFSAGIYVVYFRTTSSHVEIIRVLHGAQNPEGQF